MKGGGTTSKRKWGVNNAKKKNKTSVRQDRPKVGWPKLKRPNLTRWSPDIRRKANSKPKLKVPSRRRHPGYKPYKAVPK